jgi:peptide deformylase
VVRVGLKGGKMVLKLVDPSHELLNTKIPTFDFKDPPTDPLLLARNLLETLIDHKCIGLSANECGLPYRVCVFYSKDPLVLFNPKLIDETSEQIVLDETCASNTNMVVKIKRPKVIKVRYQDATGEFHIEKFIGMTARAILHELDHLNGISYTKRANPIHLQRAYNKKKQLDRQHARELKQAI